MNVFRRNQGVISVLLVIVLIPVLTASSILVEMIKYRSICQLLDVINSNAILSSMADYNKDLFKKYGLLAMDGERDEDINYWIAANLAMDNNIFSQLTDPNALITETTELYSLQNVDVLKMQIMENQKLEGPYSFMEDVLGTAVGFDDLFKEFGKQLKKAIPGLALFQGITECLDGVGGAANQANEFLDKRNEWSICVSEYETAHTTYISAINGVISQYRTDYPKGSTDSEILSDKKTYLGQIEKDYLNAIKELKTKGDEVIEAVNKLIEECAGALSTVTETATEQKWRETKSKLEEEKSKQIKEINDDTKLSTKEKAKQVEEITKTYADIEIQETVYKNIPQSTANGFEGVIGAAGNFDCETLKSVLAQNVSALVEEVEKFDEYSHLLIVQEDVVDEDGEKVLDENGNVKKQTVYYANSELGSGANYRTIEELAPNLGDCLRRVAEELQKKLEAPQDSFMELINGMYGVVQSLISSVMFYDAAGNVVLEEGKAWPSKNMTVSNLSFETGDEAAVAAVLQEMRDSAEMLGYNIDALYPANRVATAQYNVDIEQTMNRAMDSLLFILGYVTKISQVFSGNFLELLNVITEFQECINSIKSLCTDIGTLVENFEAVLNNATTMLYEGVMLNGYVINHFTSRADIKTSDRILQTNTGNSDGFSGSGGGGFRTGAPEGMVNDDCFKFAKSEYVVGGSTNEWDNQKTVSITIYFIRLILNIIPVVMNADVSALAGATGPFAILVYILVIAAETVLDVAVIQGTDSGIPLIKTQILCSKETVTDICKNLPEVAAGQKISSELDQNLDILMNIIGGVIGKVYKNDLFKLQYEDYLWLRLCFVSSDNKVKRIADLIYMEMIQGNENFKLDEQYTCLRVDLEAEYSTIMPIYSELDILTLRSTKYVGY